MSGKMNRNTKYKLMIALVVVISLLVAAGILYVLITLRIGQSDEPNKYFVHYY